MCKDYQERDELRARFTAWMKVIALRTRRRYLSNRNKTAYVPLEEAPLEFLAENDGPQQAGNSFCLEEQRLAEAFEGLPDRKRQVLTMLFVMEMEPEEIAIRLGCTVQNVYNQRSLALARLRNALKGGERNDEK